MARRRMGARSGATLLELVIALAVASVVAAAAHQTLAAVIDLRDRARAERARALTGAAARATLEAWLRSATLVTGTPFQGIGGHPWGTAGDEVVFGVADAGVLRPGAHRIRLWVDRDPAGARRGLLAELVPLGAGAAATADTIVIARGAAGMALRYRAEPGAEWVAGWAHEDRLPAAIELRLVPAFATDTGPNGLPPLLAAPIVVALNVPGPTGPGR